MNCIYCQKPTTEKETVGHIKKALICTNCHKAFVEEERENIFRIYEIFLDKDGIRLI